MQNKKIKAQDTLITPEQIEQTKAQSLEKRVEALCDRLERNYKNAMEFQAIPIQVLNVDDIEKVVKVRVSEPEGYLQDVTLIKNVLTNEHGHVKAFGTLLQRMERTLEYYKPTLVISKPEDEAKGFKKAEASLMAWWNSRKGFRWRIGAFCAVLEATILVGLYCYQWSDDAWARRAYDAAATVDGEDNPGRYYQWARETFDRKGRKTARDKILHLEDKVREISGEL